MATKRKATGDGSIAESKVGKKQQKEDNKAAPAAVKEETVQVMTSSIVIPKLPHCSQSPDLEGVLQVVVDRSKKTTEEIQAMITAGKITLTGKIIKDCFRDLGYDGNYSYNTSCFAKNKEGMQAGLLDILTGAYKPSCAIRGDVYEKLVQEKKLAEDAFAAACAAAGSSATA
jgi:hypothetical protein